MEHAHGHEVYKIESYIGHAHGGEGEMHNSNTYMHNKYVISTWFAKSLSQVKLLAA